MNSLIITTIMIDVNKMFHSILDIKEVTAGKISAYNVPPTLYKMFANGRYT